MRRRSFKRFSAMLAPNRFAFALSDSSTCKRTIDSRASRSLIFSSALLAFECWHGCQSTMV
jgi:hypothetical protein